jgi:hypothetical protein
LKKVKELWMMIEMKECWALEKKKEQQDEHVHVQQLV